MTNLFIPYKSTERTEYRIREIHKLLEENPRMTLQAIGDALGVTKERVRQLLVKQGLPTRGIKNES